MKILFPTDVFPPGGSGGSQSAAALARALAARGHEVLVVRPARPGSPAEEIFAGIRVKNAGHFLAKILPARIFREFFAASAMTRAICAAARDFAPGVIHAQHRIALRAAIRARRGVRNFPPVGVLVRDSWPICWKGTAWPARSGDLGSDGVCRRNSANFGAGCRACAVKNLGPVAGFFLGKFLARRARAEAAALRAADFVVANSKFTAEISRRAGADPEKISVVESVFDPAIFPPPVDFSKRAGVAFLGKLNPEKGADLVLAVARRLPDEKFFTVGDGALRGDFEKFAAENPNFKFFPTLENRRWLEALARAKVAIFPNRWPEPLGRTILESLALGTPVVATATGGTPEIVTPEMGRICPPDGEKLTAAVREILSAPREIFEKMSAAGRARAAKNAPEKTAAEIEKIYRRVAGAGDL